MTAQRRRAIAPAATAVLVCLLLVLAGAPSQAASDADTIASRANAARADEGLAPLSRNASLDAVALAWAHQMAEDEEMSHNPDVAEQIPGGWRRVGENVAYGYPTGAAMHAGWMGSSGHRANILGDYTDIGIAFLKANGTTWGVQVFASYPGSSTRPAPTSPTATATPKPSPSPTKPKATEARPSATPSPSPRPTSPSVTPSATTPTTATPSAATVTPTPTPTDAPFGAAAPADGPPGGEAAVAGPLDGIGPTATAGALAAVAVVAVGGLLIGRRRASATTGRHRG
ncbi:CAP domain-containing protein [Mumia sp. DW29H23]|uniref:CAP domain-containing protein n=1 Tax=Mumia sp. DW29H23 TaxID=3421241 RepID=UPI003D69456E